MRWPWSRPPEHRGTLALLADKKAVIGLPMNISVEQRDHILTDLRSWLDEGEPKPLLVFPFPVDVVDKR